MRLSARESVSSEESGGRHSVVNGDASSSADTIMSHTRLMGCDISVSFVVI